MLRFLIPGMFAGGLAADMAMMTGYSFPGALAAYSGIGSLGSLAVIALTLIQP